MYLRLPVSRAQHEAVSPGLLNTDIYKSVARCVQSRSRVSKCDGRRNPRECCKKFEQRMNRLRVEQDGEREFPKQEVGR